MQRALQGKRFPRRAFTRRVNLMMAEIDWWKDRYSRSSFSSESPSQQLWLHERWEQLDGVWHALQSVQRAIGEVR